MEPFPHEPFEMQEINTRTLVGSYSLSNILSELIGTRQLDVGQEFDQSRIRCRECDSDDAVVAVKTTAFVGSQIQVDYGHWTKKSCGKGLPFTHDRAVNSFGQFLIRNQQNPEETQVILHRRSMEHHMTSIY